MASKRHLRRTKCETKKRFRSEDEARIRARQIHKHGRDLLTAYQCRHCKGFHLGHLPGTRQEHQSVALATAF